MTDHFYDKSTKLRISFECPVFLQGWPLTCECFHNSGWKEFITRQEKFETDFARTSTDWTTRARREPRNGHITIIFGAFSKSLDKQMCFFAAQNSWYLLWGNAQQSLPLELFAHVPQDRRGTRPRVPRSMAMHSVLPPLTVPAHVNMYKAAVITLRWSHSQEKFSKERSKYQRRPQRMTQDSGIDVQGPKMKAKLKKAPE